MFFAGIFSATFNYNINTISLQRPALLQTMSEFAIGNARYVICEEFENSV